MLLIFDYDGTLVDSEYALSERVAEIATAAGFTIDTSTVFQNFSGLSSAEKFRGIAQYCNKPLDSDALAALEAQHKTAKIDLYDLTDCSHVFNGAAEALGQLQKDNDLAICSNGEHKPLLRAMHRIGLARYFNNQIYTAESLGVLQKPHPDMINYALDVVGKNPEDAAFVGDTYADPQAAKAAGITRRIAFISPRFVDPAARQRTMRCAGATHFFSRYQDLPEIIAG